MEAYFNENIDPSVAVFESNYEGRETFVEDENFKEYLKNNKNYSIETIDSMNEEWRKKDFSNYRPLCNILAYCGDIHSGCFVFDKRI